jgi:glycosyltransferase involved in cell wall biosynthesis
MRILFDARVFQIPFTGIAKSTLCLYKNCLKQQRLEFLGVHYGKLFEPLPPEIRTRVVGRIYPKQFWATLAFPRSVKRAQPDIVHFPWNGGVPNGINDARVVTTIHDVLPLEIPGYFGKSSTARETYCSKTQNDIDRSDIIFTVSEYSKKQIISHFKVSDEKLNVLHHGPTLDRPRKQHQPTEDYFIYVGGYGNRKNLPMILETYLHLYKLGQIRSKLIFVGTPSFISKRFESMLFEGKKLGVVQEKGYVKDDMLASLLSQAKALVYPSEYEGFGLPALDAMNLGCPVVTTRGTALPEVCGNAAYYIDPTNPEDFNRAYLDLEQNDSLRNELIQKGKEQARKFSWDRTTAIFLSTLEKALRA